MRIIYIAFFSSLLICFSACNQNKNSSSDKGQIVLNDQIWSSSNLAVTHFRNGDPIPELKTNAEWRKAIKKKRPGFCYYDNNSSKGSTVGVIYNFYALKDERGLAPEGWRIPNDNDWIELSEFLKKRDPIQMQTCNEFNNSMGGCRKYVNELDEIGYEQPTNLNSAFENGNEYSKFGYWWSTSGKSVQLAGGILIPFDQNTSIYTSNYSNQFYKMIEDKDNGYYVKCIKNN